jgi:hypothetical protein
MFRISIFQLRVTFLNPQNGYYARGNVRYLEKMKKYPDFGPKFKPLVIESTSGWHNYLMDYLKSIAGHSPLVTMYRGYVPGYGNHVI